MIDESKVNPRHCCIILLLTTPCTGERISDQIPRGLMRCMFAVSRRGTKVVLHADGLCMAGMHDAESIITTKAANLRKVSQSEPTEMELMW